MNPFKNPILRRCKLTYFPVLIVIILVVGCRPKVEISESDKTQSQISEHVQSLVDEIVQDSYIGTEQVARKQQTDPAYTRRLELMQIASDDELLALTGSKNPIIGLIAFEGLYNRGNSTVPVIFNGFKSRNDRIRYLRGDVMMEMPMLEYAYVYVMRYTIPDEEPPFDEKTMPKYELLPKEQKAIIEKIDGLRARDR